MKVTVTSLKFFRKIFVFFLTHPIFFYHLQYITLEIYKQLRYILDLLFLFLLLQYL